MLFPHSILKAVGVAYVLLSLTACLDQGGAVEVIVCGGEGAEDHAHEEGEAHLYVLAEPCGGAHAHTETTSGADDHADEHADDHADETP